MSNQLFDAIERHDLQEIVAFLQSGADPNASHPITPDWVPLKAAIEELSEGGPIEAVVVLLRFGARPDGGQERNGATPLVVAALNRQPEAIRLLLVAGANPSVRDEEGDTPMGICQRLQEMSQSAEFLRLCGATE